MHESERCILIAAAISIICQPTHGELPGCPLAGGLLSLIMSPLVKKLRNSSDTVQARDYFDDITFTSTAKENRIAEVLEGRDIIGRFGQVMGWERAETKCHTFSTCAKYRTQMRGIPGMQEAGTFQDLGATQQAHLGRDTKAAVERDRKALERASRIGRLPLPFDTRSRMLAAGPMAAAMYAVSIQAMSEDRIARLRRGVVHAIWPGNQRVAAEVTLTLLSNWRTDPRAISIIEPWRKLRTALQNGTISMDDCDTLAGAQQSAGPCAAIQDSLRRMGATYERGAYCGSPKRSLTWPRSRPSSWKSPWPSTTEQDSAGFWCAAGTLSSP